MNLFVLPFTIFGQLFRPLICSVKSINFSHVLILLLGFAACLVSSPSHALQDRLLVSEDGIAFVSTPTLSRLTHSVSVTTNLGIAGSWTASSNQSWLTVTPSSNTGGTLTLTANPAGLPSDATSYATVTITSANAATVAATVKVAIWVGTTTPTAMTKLPQSYAKVVTDKIRPLAYVNNGGTSIDIYNIYTAQKVGTIGALGGALGDMTVSGNGDRLYVPDTASGTMVVVDLIAQAKLTTWPLSKAVGQYTHLISIHPNGKELVLVGDGTAYTAEGMVLAGSTISSVISATSDGRKVYVQDEGSSPSGIGAYSVSYSENSGGTLTVTSTGSNGFVNGSSNGKDIAVSPDGTRVYMASGAPYKCSRVDPVDLSFVGSLPGGEAYPNNVEVGNDGRVYCGISGWYSEYDVWMHSTDGALLKGFKFAGYARALLNRQMVISADGMMMVALTDDPVLAFIPLGPPPPQCTLAATAGNQAGTTVLTASCEPAATSFDWSASTGSGNTATGTITIPTPAVLTTYTVTGSSALGPGNTASVSAGVPCAQAQCPKAYKGDRLLVSEDGIAFVSTPTLSRLRHSVSVTNNLGVAGSWTASSNQPWLTVTPSGTIGNTGGTLTLNANPAGLPSDTTSYATVTISSDNAATAAATIKVAIWVGTTTPTAMTKLPQSYAKVVTDKIRPLAYVNNGGTSIDIYNLYTAQKVGTIGALGGALGDMTVSGNGDSLYVLDTVSKAMVVVDLVAQAKLTTWPLSKAVGQYTHLISIHPNGRELVLVGDGTAYTAEGTVLAGSTISSVMSATSDGRKVFVQNEGYSPSSIGAYSVSYSENSGGTLTVSSTGSNGFVNGSSNGKDIAVSPDGTRVYMASGAPYKCSRVDPVNLSFVGSLPGGEAYPNNVEVGNDGRVYCGISGGYSRYEVWMHSADGALLNGFKLGSLRDRQMVISPDGMMMVALTNGPELAFVPLGPPPPQCTLATTAGNQAGTTVLTASCEPAATSYAWSANTGSSNTATGTITIPTPAILTTYTVTGSSAAGSGNTATVNVGMPCVQALCPKAYKGDRLLVSEDGIAFVSTPTLSRLTHSVTVTNNLGVTGSWTASSNQSWLTVTPSGTIGNTGGTLTLTANPAGLPSDATSYATVTISSDNAATAAATVKVAIWVGTTTPTAMTKLPQSYAKVVTDKIRPLAYVNNGGTSIDIYNIYTAQKVGTIGSLGAALGDMTVSGNGDSLYVLDTASRAMVVVDLVAQAKLTTWPLSKAVGQYTHLISIHPNGKELVLVGDDTAYTAEGTVLAGSTISSVISGTSDGRKVFTLGGVAYSLSYSEGMGGTLTIKMNGSFVAASDIATSPDGTKVYMASGAPYQCSRLDPVDLSLVGSLPGGEAYPNNVEVGNDGRVYCGISGWYSEYDVWMHSADGALLKGFKFAGYARALRDRQMVISADGMMMVALTDDPVLAFVPLGPPPPKCTLNATAGGQAGTTVLTASCEPAATSYAWSANTGSSNTATGTITIPTPAVLTTYTVTGSSAAGSGNTATVNVGMPCVQALCPKAYKADRLLVSEDGIAFVSTPTLSRLTHSVSVTNNLGVAGSWTASSNQPWLTVTPSGTIGNTGGTLTLTANPAGLPSDATSYATVTITSDNAATAAATVKVAIWVGTTTPTAMTKLPQSYAKVVTDKIRPLAYVNNGGTSIDIYNIYTAQKVGTIGALGAALGDMTVSGNGDSLYVLDTASRAMVEVDLIAQAKLTTWPLSKAVGQYTHLISIHPNGKELILVGDGTAYTAEGTVLAGSTISSVMSATSDGRKVFVQNEGYSPSSIGAYSVSYSENSGGTLTVSRTGSNWSVNNSSNGTDIAVSPDGTRVYMASGAPYKCSRVDPVNLSFVGSLPGGEAYPNNVEVGNDGRVYCGNSDGYSRYEVWMHSADGALLNGFKLGSLRDRQMVISPDGMMMVALTNGPELAFVPLGPPPPQCTLAATAGNQAGTTVLTASCEPAATSYAWSANTGSSNTATGTITIPTPAVLTTYTLTGSSALGTGNTASVSVVVSPAKCTLSASPVSISVGGASVLTANCSPAATSYSWTGGTGTLGANGCTTLGVYGNCLSSKITFTVKPSATSNYAVAGINGGGTGNVASASVFVASVVPNAPTITAVSVIRNDATISFTPGTNGNGLITYTVICTAAGQAPRSASGSYSPIVVSGLTMGVHYWCSVVASNMLGNSAASQPVSVTSRGFDIGPLLLLLLD